MIFWNADDFRSLNISAHYKQYFVFFLWQRFLLDSFISNLIVGVGLSIFLFIKFGILQVLAFLLLVIMYFIISPSCSVIYSKKNKITTAICVSVLLIIPTYCSLILLWHLATSLYSICTITDFIYCCLFSAICCFTIVSKTCKAQK